MGKAQHKMSEATNRQISNSTKCNSKQTVKKSDEHSEWLPDGWIVDSKTRKSGAHMGCGYKCYIDPTGRKFYSKPEVLRYIKTININSHSSKKEKMRKSNDAGEKSTAEDLPPEQIIDVKIRRGSNSCRIKPDAVEKSQVEDLPPGWTIEAKVRKGGTGNRKDLFYIDPVSGYVFRSKKDALRYVKSGDISSCVIKPYKQQIQDEDEVSNADEKSTIQDLPPGQMSEVKIRKGGNDKRIDPDWVEKSQVEDLPPGWITEAKARKGGSGKKKDLFYLDPVSGYVFRSKKDALRYVNSGDIDTCVLKPYKRGIQDEDGISPSSIGKRQKLTQSAANQQLAVGQRDVKSQSLEHATAHTPEMMKTFDSGSLALIKDDMLENGHFVNVMEHASEKNHSNSSLSKTKESNVARRFSRRLSRAEPDQLTDVANEQALQVPKRKLGKSVSILDTDLTNKSSQQLSGVLEIKRSYKEQGEVLLNSKKSRTKEEKQTFCRSSKRLAGFQPKLMSNSSSQKTSYKSKKSKGDVKATLQQSDGQPVTEFADHASINGESSNKGRKLPKATPITSNQLKKFDDEEINNDGKSELDQSFAFHYSWSDPCLEFAIQTLTGALPVEDSTDNGQTRVSETDTSPKNQLVENVTGSSSDKTSRVNSKQSKNKKELTVPRRLSKRLAGNEPEVLPTEKAAKFAPQKSCNDKLAATANLTNGVSGYHRDREESELVVQSSDRLKTSCGESLIKSEKSYDAQTVPDEQIQRHEDENADDERSYSQFPTPFGDSWSDPCLEFAIKTLSGDLPVDAPAADILPVVTPDVSDPPNKESLQSVEQKSINAETHENPYQSQTKKEFNTVCHSSKQDLNQPEVTTYSTSFGNDPKFATRESYKDEDSITRNSNEREPQRIKSGNALEIDINKTILEEEPQPETINYDNSDREFGASFMDSWSDPCLEFAFNTLSGSIPVEENITIQACFQERAHSNGQRGGFSTVPDFGFSSISHSGISFHNNIGENSKSVQQSTASSSFLPQEKQGLNAFFGVDPQEQYFQNNNNNFQRK
ncbi:methyl-CpG-binding domain-containing protein 13 isoform X1 [Vigna radiata var. radiata]|uniref:Methyl-CpG-binding domain-containing protein 13 isoform X1 n=1 Tax=Vigna radiata var. radiata TaxID=3916 RepID=A0A3Q0ELS9_VIGRR|nr:methyl-CpG-binding domain-containing protein 13 isoform X1 [Vigna radiata var. radiata]XP_022631334.1 methyl-CpG-binding domain-containing protein 13 isoform X1 [Vigna radiata var. radiata]